ncbi:MAG: hypothetical protein HZA34_03105 [Candidatus Pacebacteria bacterium]|nr:hypothetical protein [Candidatus Paceibacterota bacterium]
MQKFSEMSSPELLRYVERATKKRGVVVKLLVVGCSNDVLVIPVPVADKEIYGAEKHDVVVKNGAVCVRQGLRQAKFGTVGGGVHTDESISFAATRECIEEFVELGLSLDEIKAFAHTVFSVSRPLGLTVFQWITSETEEVLRGVFDLYSVDVLLNGEQCGILARRGATFLQAVETESLRSYMQVLQKEWRTHAN